MLGLGAGADGEEVVTQDVTHAGVEVEVATGIASDVVDPGTAREGDAVIDAVDFHPEDGSTVDVVLQVASASEESVEFVEGRRVEEPELTPFVEAGDHDGMVRGGPGI